MIQIEPISPYDPQMAALLKASDEFMGQLYPAESNHLDGPETLNQAHVVLLGARKGEEILGCGAVKKLAGYGEIKRLFVHANARGLGVAKAIMSQLEAHLVEQNIPLARLEVGIHQPDALALYQRLGYRPIDPFGDYPLDPLSAFYEKDLSGITACK